MGRAPGVCLLIALATAVTAAATAQATPLRLTMDEAVARAAAVSTDLTSSRADVKEAEANVGRQEKLLPANPYISVGVQPNIESHFAPSYSFGFSQEFEIGGQRAKRVDVARQSLERMIRQVEHTQQSLVANVKSAFVSALGAEQRVALTQEELEAAQDFAREIEGRSAGGEPGRIDLNAAEVQVSRARRDLAIAQQGAGDAKGLLRYYLALPPEREIELVGTLETDVLPLPLESEVVELALQRRSDLAALRQTATVADHRIDLAERQRIPNFTLSTSVSRFEGDTFAGVDVGLFLPVFDGSAADITDAMAEREKARADVDDTTRIITWEVARAYRACVAAGAGLDIVREEIVPRNRDNLELEKSLFERGEVTTVEVIGIQIDLVSARRELLDALIEYNSSLIDLERVTGGPIEAP